MKPSPSIKKLKYYADAHQPSAMSSDLLGAVAEIQKLRELLLAASIKIVQLSRHFPAGEVARTQAIEWLISEGLMPDVSKLPVDSPEAQSVAGLELKIGRAQDVLRKIVSSWIVDDSKWLQCTKCGALCDRNKTLEHKSFCFGYLAKEFLA
jgi:hypothetical protein